ncbi:hypothetical protein GCM10022206_69350 [Streptomyces chiangmaiensis]
MGTEFLVVPVVDQRAVVEMRPVLDPCVVALDGAEQQDGSCPLEVGFVVGVEGDPPGSACAVGADETTAGPVVVGQDAAQHLGVGMVAVPAPAELDGVELVADALCLALC